MDDTLIPGLFGLVFVFFVAIFIAVAIAAWKYQRKRNEELWALATRLGLQFSIDDPLSIDDRPNWNELFTGHSREVSSVMYGRMDEYLVQAFDFSYKTGSGKDESSHSVSALIFDTNLWFPELTARPENVLDRIAGAIGFNDIDFESDEFSRKFCVTSKDKRFAYAVMHPQMMEFLLSQRTWYIVLSQQSLIFYDIGTLDAAGFEAGFAFGRQFLSLLPDYLKQELSAGRNS